MSRISRMNMIIMTLAIAVLVLSLSAPALAASQNHKATPTPLPAATPSPPPAASPAPPGSGIINVTPNTPTFPGHGKIGNLHTPPAIIKNLTQKAKKQVNDVRVDLARRVAEGRISLIISQLQLYEKWVGNSGLSDDQKAGISVIVGENIAWFRQQIEDIGAAGDLATIQSLADEVDRQAATLQVSIKKEAGIMACDGLDGRIATARDASAGIADKIAVMKAGGINTVTVEQKLADYDLHVEAAVQYSTAARYAFEGITGADNMDNGFNEGYRQIRLANQEMTQAYVDLKNVYLWYLHASRNR